MAQESDAAHAEVEAFLRSGSGQSIAQVAVILSYASHDRFRRTAPSCTANVANDTLLFTNRFPAHPRRRAES